MELACEVEPSVAQVLRCHLDDDPSDVLELASTSIVVVERELPEVALVALVLEADALLGIRSVETSNELSVVPNLVLRNRWRKPELTEQPQQLRLLRALGYCFTRTARYASLRAAHRRRSVRAVRAVPGLRAPTFASTSPRSSARSSAISTVSGEHTAPSMSNVSSGEVTGTLSTTRQSAGSSALLSWTTSPPCRCARQRGQVISAILSARSR